MNLLYILLLALWSPLNSVVSPFLIYNENHDKCVKVVSSFAVQAASCNVSSEDQQFQWISSTQISSARFKACLGAEEIKNWVKVILLPCNEIDPVQTWECKEETLFGLKGQPLHLNYGNYYESNVMLFNGTGVWSRWLIHGTKENLCLYQDIPVPNITLFRQTEDRDHVIVMCSFGRKSIDSLLQLLLDGEHNHTQINPLCCSNAVCVFDVKVSPPVSFTCVHKIHFAMNMSETLTYNPSDCNHRSEGISLFYICFSSIIAVGLIIMTVTVTVISIRSKDKVHTVPTMRFTNDYDNNF